MNIAIVGAGAAGLFLAGELSRNSSFNVFIFEKSKKIGTKIKASCGGKANIFNTNVSNECYNQPVLNTLLKNVTPEIIRNEFENMGLMMVQDDENRVFPATLFSQTVIDVLLNQLTKKTKIITGHPVTNISCENGNWLINDCDIRFQKVIMATGSPAAMIEKNRQDFTQHLNTLQLKQKPFSPSLVGFKLKNYPQKLFGCRTHAIVSLFQDNKLIHKEKGEIVFKEDGISGIVILNCSAFYNRLSNKKNCRLSLNFLYLNEQYDWKNHLAKHHSLKGILHTKLCDYFEKTPFDPTNLPFEIDSPYGLEFAQVCNGGVILDEIDDHFEVRKHPGLFALGEMLDVDGICGGYNLFFAFASAYQLAQYLSDEN